MKDEHRIVCWFSCGAASAVATKLTLQKYGWYMPVVIAYTQVVEEHPDNMRFLRDCEKWFGQKIEILRNESYHASIVEVFDRLKFMSTISGAPCTFRLKKEVRRRFERPTDEHVFGFTLEEQHRVDRWIDANADKRILPVLIDAKLTHEDCLAIIKKAGIEVPAMYKLGYDHNNCVGCVKGGLGYWNKIRRDFPEVFEARARQEERLGARLLNYRGKRISLRELPPNAGRYEDSPEPACGALCELVSHELEE